MLLMVVMPISLRVAVAVHRVAAVAHAPARRAPNCGDGGRGGAAALSHAIVDALQETRAFSSSDTLAQVRRPVRVAGKLPELLLCVLDVVVGLIKTELGLDRSAVNAVGVEALPHPLGEDHVFLASCLGDREGDLDVHRGDNLGVRQLPDVYVVAGDDSGKALDVFTDVLNLDSLRRGLQEDLGCGKSKRECGLENDEGDEQRDSRIGVVLSRPVGQPDDQSCNNNTDVAQGISKNVKDHSVHAHVAMTVSVT